MLRKLVGAALVLAVLVLAALWVLSAPRAISAAQLPQHTPDIANGQLVFWAGGCESCHAVAGAQGDDRLKLGGGQVLATPFGKFHVPNISPDPGTGIGKWSLADFVSAMKLGVAPGGVQLYPAFPYPSYQRMTLEDLIDLKAFLDTLPPVVRADDPHELAFPFNVRRGLGLWQLIYIDGKTFTPDPGAAADVNRGAYLVEGPGHCTECHTPRSFTGATDPSKWLSGAPMLDGSNGVALNITPDASGLAKWTPAQITRVLQVGLKPTFDSIGGAMGPVVANMAMLPKSDVQAIAAYLKTVRALPASATPTAPAAAPAAGPAKPVPATGGGTPAPAKP